MVRSQGFTANSLLPDAILKDLSSLAQVYIFCVCQESLESQLGNEYTTLGV